MQDVYILLGPEKGLKEDFINKIKASLGSFEISKFYGFEDYEEELFAQLSNEDLFCEHKLVILDSAEEIKTKDKTKAICSYIANPSPSVTFLIISRELYISADIMASVPNQKEQILKFYELFENKKSEWIASFFRRNSLSIDSDACDAIIEKVENNIQEFENVCSQMVIYVTTVEGKSRVTQEDVETFLSHTRQETDFSLFSYMAYGKLESALECLHTLMTTNDNSSQAAVICSRLSGYFRRLYSIHMVQSKGAGADEALKQKYFDSDRPITMLKDRDVYKNALSRYRARDTERILVLLSEYDIAVKQTPAPLQQTLLEKCIVDIVVNKGRHARKAVFAQLGK